MANQATATHGVMEGGGSYNRHARIPAGGGDLALPFLEQAAESITLDDGNQPVVIADYGSSQGKNSLAPMRAAHQSVAGTRWSGSSHSCRAHRSGGKRFQHALRRAPQRPRTLFRERSERISLGDWKIVLREGVSEGHVHLGWSSYAAVWLNRIPRLIPGHFVALASTGEVREAFERQAADDWKFFLSLRASELRPGGRLVIVLPGLTDEGASGFEPLFRHANEALAEMVAEGTITAEERAEWCSELIPGEDASSWHRSVRTVSSAGYCGAL